MIIYLLWPLIYTIYIPLRPSSSGEYIGDIYIGVQKFSVLFDTGSGNLVVPNIQSHCQNKVLYNSTSSPTNLEVAYVRHDLIEGTNVYTKSKEPRVLLGSNMIHQDIYLLSDKTRTNKPFRSTTQDYKLPGVEYYTHGPRDQLEIGYGTGKLTGVFSQDKICLKTLCCTSLFISAIELSPEPFDRMDFDGILGLSLQGLSEGKIFNIIDQLFGSVYRKDRNISKQLIISHPYFLHFAYFETMESFVVIGEEYYDPVSPIDDKIYIKNVAPTSYGKPNTFPTIPGYWQIAIPKIQLKIHNEIYDISTQAFLGVIDTGTTNIGIPSTLYRKFLTFKNNLLIEKYNDEVNNILPEYIYLRNAYYQCRRKKIKCVKIYKILKLYEDLLFSISIYFGDVKLPFYRILDTSNVDYDKLKIPSENISDNFNEEHNESDNIIHSNIDPSVYSSEEKVLYNEEYFKSKIQKSDGNKNYLDFSLMNINVPPPIGPNVIILGIDFLKEYSVLLDRLDYQVILFRL